MLEERVAAIVAGTLRMDANQLPPEQPFDEMNLDTLDMVEILMDLEEEFDVLFEENAIFSSVNEIVHYIRNHMNQTCVSAC